RLDIRQALSTMTFEGEPGIHRTQLRCSASMLARGFSVEETVQRILTATRRAAGDLAPRWNWRSEEHAVRKMCADWIKKHRDATMNIIADFKVPLPAALTEIGLADTFAGRHFQKLRYVRAWGKWFIWNGHLWQDDKTGIVEDMVRELCDE